MKAHIDINVETDEDADIDDINKKKRHGDKPSL